MRNIQFGWENTVLKIHKISIWCASIISLISFTIAFYLNTQICKFEFWVNLLIGIFASSLLVLATSVIGYLTSKNETLHKFENEAYELIKQFLKISNNNDPYIQMDCLQEIGHYNIVNFKNIYGDISFFLNFIKSKKRLNINELYQRIIDMKEDVSKANDDLTKRIISADGKFENEIKKYMEEYRHKEKALINFFESNFYGGKENE